MLSEGDKITWIYGKLAEKGWVKEEICGNNFVHTLTKKGKKEFLEYIKTYRLNNAKWFYALAYFNYLVDQNFSDKALKEAQKFLAEIDINLTDYLIACIITNNEKGKQNSSR